jgi:hypothetical protein
MAQHAELTQERWSNFTIDQQILMIANEMNRASALVSSGDLDRVKNCYERVLQLTDLTVRGGIRSSLRGELLRWRNLIVELYLEDRAQPDDHRRAFRCLLRFTPEASGQIPYLGAAAARE